MRNSVTHQRGIRADLLLIHNVRALLRARGIDEKDLAFWCGHKPPWINKILNGTRGVALEDVGKIADFFGLTVAQLFQQGISALYERRRAERRSDSHRRGGQDRRHGPA